MPSRTVNFDLFAVRLCRVAVVQGSGTITRGSGTVVVGGCTVLRRRASVAGGVPSVPPRRGSGSCIAEALRCCFLPVVGGNLPSPWSDLLVDGGLPGVHCRRESDERGVALTLPAYVFRLTRIGSRVPAGCRRLAILRRLVPIRCRLISNAPGVVSLPTSRVPILRRLIQQSRRFLASSMQRSPPLLRIRNTEVARSDLCPSHLCQLGEPPGSLSRRRCPDPQPPGKLDLTMIEGLFRHDVQRLDETALGRGHLRGELNQPLLILSDCLPAGVSAVRRFG
jgi:hypothetical protein